MLNNVRARLVFKQMLGLVGVATLAVTMHLMWIGAPVASSRSEVRGEITIQELASNDEDVLWVDVRPLQAFAKGHVTDAIRLPESQLDDFVGDLIDVSSIDTTIVVYCDTDCDVSSRVANRLRLEYGFENVRVLKGGFSAWQAAQDR